MSKIRYLAIGILLLAVVSVVIGSVFISQGVEKNNWIKGAMQVEKITLDLDEDEVAAGNVIDSATEAQTAADTLREHRRGIAPTYSELMGEGRYDPSNPAHLSYAQALNLENYLYLAVLSFGVIDIVIVIGVFMIIVGIALGATGVTALVLARKQS
ncbi:hypothetical protein ACFLVI_04415 [Chloroflexota bacterium]